MHISYRSKGSTSNRAFQAVFSVGESNFPWLELWAFSLCRHAKMYITQQSKEKKKTKLRNDLFKLVLKGLVCRTLWHLTEVADCNQRNDPPLC